MEGVIYVNAGDFVESCSLVVEHYDGRFEVLRWKDPLPLAARVEGAASDDEPADARAEEAQAEAA